MRGVCVGRTFGFTKRCQVYEPLKNSLGCNALKSGHYSLKQLFNYPSIIPQQQPAPQLQLYEYQRLTTLLSVICKLFGPLFLKE